MYNNPRRETRHWIGIGFLVVFAVFVAAMIYYMFTYVPTSPPAGMVYWFPFGWLWAFFGFFIFFGLLRFAFWGPWRWGGYRRYGYGYGRENEAYHILRERYARGEITKPQYDAMMRDLYQQQQSPQARPPY